MLLRCHSTPQTFLAFLVATSFSSSANADSWGERTDIGVAALDRQTGQILWEAWQPDQIPSELSKASKAGVERLLPGAKRSPKFGKPLFPTAVSKDRVVDYTYDEEENPCFVLAHGKPEAIGAVIARCSFDDNARWRYRLFNGTLYCLRDTQVYAFQTTITEEAKDRKWEPAWTFDLLAGLPKEKWEIAKLAPLDLHVNTEGVWVVNGPRILQLTPEGRLQSQFQIKHLNWNWFDHYMGTPLTFGKHLIYYRSTREVIALDWQKKREVWRLATTLAPTISCVKEIEENLVIAQIGSDVPRAIQETLKGDGDSSKKRSHSTRERIAAARLLHSYGDGYLRSKLREYRAELYRRKDDAEAKQAGAVLDELLATWPRKRDRQRLVNTCVAALLQGEKKEPRSVFASPANQRLLTWSLLRDEIGGWHGVNEVVEKLVAHCRQILATSPSTEKPFAVQVLLSRHVGWFRLTDSERKQLFLSRDDSIWQEMAESLVMNGWREEMVQWAWDRPAADQPKILPILGRHPVKKWSKAELNFWLDCARNHPGQVAYWLKEPEDEGEIPLAFRPSIRDYLEKEIAKPMVKEGGVQEAYDLVAALYVLDRWKKPEDTALLRKYLKHPCDSIGEHVKAMLEQRDAERPPSEP